MRCCNWLMYSCGSPGHRGPWLYCISSVDAYGSGTKHGDGGVLLIVSKYWYHDLNGIVVELWLLRESSRSR